MDFMQSMWSYEEPTDSDSWYSQVNSTRLPESVVLRQPHPTPMPMPEPVPMQPDEVEEPKHHKKHHGDHEDGETKHHHAKGFFKKLSAPQWQSHMDEEQTIKFVDWFIGAFATAIFIWGCFCIALSQGILICIVNKLRYHQERLEREYRPSAPVAPQAPQQVHVAVPQVQHQVTGRVNWESNGLV